MNSEQLNGLVSDLSDECLCDRRAREMCVCCRSNDAIDELRSERDAALAAQATTQDALNRLSARHAVVLQELDKATDDTRRLDWLEQYQPTADHDGEMLIALVGSWTFNRVRHNEGLRAAIDAAINGGA